jgi:hypothetical protein
MASDTPIDSGTLALTTSPSPGTVGTPSTHQLSDDDLAFVRTTAGRTIGGSRMALQDLQRLREVHAVRQAAAARESGPDSWAARFEQATVDRFDLLIEEARSPFGSATEQVRALTQEVRTSGSAGAEDRLRKAIEVLLGMERQRQLLGVSDDSSETNTLLGDALNASAARRNGVLQSLIDRARRDRRSVTDEELQKAMVAVVTVERQRQLMGVSQPGDNEAMELVNEAASLRGPGAVRVGPDL